METRTAKVFNARMREVEQIPLLPLLKRYGVVVAVVLLAFGVRYAMAGILGGELPFTLFIAAALVAAWYGGAPTGIVALLVGLFVADYFFVGSPGAGSVGSNWFRIVRYLFTASLGIGLIEVLHRARRRTESALKEAQTEAKCRRESEAKLLEAHELLQKHAGELDRRIDERTSELQANVSSLQEIVYNIAHCLRAPIRASASYSQIFMEQYGAQLDTSGKEYIYRIHAAAARMNALTQDLLEFGNVAQRSVTLGRVNLTEAVKEAAARLQAQIEGEGAEVVIEGELPEVRAQDALVVQIVSELIDNALRFAKAGTTPKIRVWTERGSSKVRLWIADDGIGIESRFHDRIFGLFEQVQPTGYTEGTGIGLAIVKKGMQRQGGDAGVESEPGKGSRFWLDFAMAGRAGGERVEFTAAA